MALYNSKLIHCLIIVTKVMTGKGEELKLYGPSKNRNEDQDKDWTAMELKW